MGDMSVVTPLLVVAVASIAVLSLAVVMCASVVSLRRRRRSPHSDAESVKTEENMAYHAKQSKSPDTSGDSGAGGYDYVVTSSSSSTNRSAQQQPPLQHDGGEDLDQCDDLDYSYVDPDRILFSLDKHDGGHSTLPPCILKSPHRRPSLFDTHGGSTGGLMQTDTRLVDFDEVYNSLKKIKEAKKNKSATASNQDNHLHECSNQQPSTTDTSCLRDSVPSLAPPTTCRQDTNRRSNSSISPVKSLPTSPRTHIPTTTTSTSQPPLRRAQQSITAPGVVKTGCIR